MALDADALILRVSNEEPHRFQANTFVTLDDIDAIIQFRVDVALWNARTEDEKVRVMVAAYKDLVKLSWSQDRGRSQAKDYEFRMRFGTVNDPPLEDTEFQYRIKEATAAQVMFILAGTQQRDMAREGVRMTRNLTGAEVEFLGYRGPVCGEAKEILAPYIELMPRTRRF